MKCFKALEICVNHPTNVAIAAYRKAMVWLLHALQSAEVMSQLDATMPTPVEKGAHSPFTFEQMFPIDNKKKKCSFANLFSRCDSFGNRPVTAPSSQYRKNAFGPGGRVRSGSTGNRPQVANNSNRPWSNQSRHHNSASNSNANNDTHNQQSSQSQPSSRSQTITRPNNPSFTIRDPPHQQQSQQHNFAAPRKGIFNLNNHSTANANTKDLNTKLVQTNNKEHNKENLVEIKKTGSTENANDNNKTTASTSGSTVAASPATNAAATGVAVTAGNGAASKKN